MIRRLALAFSAASIVACSNGLGAPYAPLSAPPSAGIVYLYRPAQYRGSNDSYLIVAQSEAQLAAHSGQGTALGYLPNGGYLPYYTTGKTRFFFAYSGQAATVDVKPGGSYYVKLQYTGGDTKGTITERSAGDANAEIQTCNVFEKGYTGRDRLN